MNGDERIPASFSLARRWGAGFNLVITLSAVLAIVAMLNYLGMRHFVRLKWTASSETELSRRTRHVLGSLTNTIKVITVFDSNEDLFPRVRALLKEYENASHGKLRVQYVDYIRDPVMANAIKAQYKLPDIGNQDLVIFDSGNGSKTVNAKTLSEYDYAPLLAGKTNEVRRTAFKGELLFTSAIYGLSTQRSPIAYFLIGQSEHSPADTSNEEGYSKFAGLLQNENNFQIKPLDLAVQKEVPSDCSLLVIAGPLQTIDDIQVDRIGHYLEQGGRLLALFNSRPLSIRRPIGLEKLFLQWGVEVGQNVVLDPENSITSTGLDPKPFASGSHPVISTLGSARTHLVKPRTVRAAGSSTRREDAKVDELLFTGRKSILLTDFTERGQYTATQVGPQPVAVAVEKSIPAIERGSTRLVIIGDSGLWSNQLIDDGANREFAAAAVNWLVQQNVLLGEIPARPITLYKLTMTHGQLATARWLLLAGMPGSVLLVGFVVWMRRRN